MNLLLAIYFFGAGLLLGSFLGVCIERIPTGETVVFGRSRCSFCGRVLAARDMIPVLSYLFLHGRCRFCGEKLSLRYPLVELLTGLAFLFAWLAFGLAWKTILLCLAACALIVAAFIDLDTQTIPDRIHVFLLALAVAACFLDPSILWWERLAGFFIISVPMLAIAYHSAGFGGGDIKLCAVCGLLVGWQAALFASLAACVTAAVYALFLMLFRHRDGLSRIPFGPFLAFGFYFSALYAQPAIRWYLSFFPS